MKFPVLMYHEIIRKGANMLNMHTSYLIEPDVFSSQLDLLKKMHINTLSIDDLFSVNSSINKTKKILITFDDGFIGNYNFAFPVLKKRGMNAVFFCAVSAIGKKNMMTWTNLREMVSENMSVQSHGYSHKPLASLPKRDVYNDLKKAKIELEDKLGKEVVCLSLPHGSYNKFVLAVASKIGYKKIFTSNLGYNLDNESLFKRINLRSEYNLDKYKEIVSGQYNYAFPIILQKCKLCFKNIIGHKNYLKLYHHIHGI